MKRTYKKPVADLAEILPEYMLMLSVGGSGYSLEEPYEMTDDDFTSIFG